MPLAPAARIALALVWWASAVGVSLSFSFVLPTLGSPLRSLAATAAVTSAMLALVGAGGAALSREPLVQRLGLGPSTARTRTLLLLVAGFLGTSQALETVIELCGLRDTGTLGEIDAALAGASGFELAWALLAIGVAPGIGEELFARGWIQRGLAPLLGSRWAIVLGAAVFGVLHADPVHAPAAFALGLYLGAAVEATGGLRVAILCHVVNNLLAVTSAALGGGDPGGVPLEPAVRAALGALGALAGAGALVVAYRGRPGPTDRAAALGPTDRAAALQNAGGAADQGRRGAEEPPTAGGGQSP
jgi:hypothetical protein